MTTKGGVLASYDVIDVNVDSPTAYNVFKSRYVVVKVSSICRRII